MNWTPKTEDEVMAAELCQKGKAPFTILEAQVTQSKSEKNAGKEMLKIKLNVHGEDGFDYHIYDYIAPWFMEHKFRHFWYCVGKGADYEAGKADIESLKGLEGWCEVGIQKAKGEYGPKNTITDYVAKNEKSAPAEKQQKVATPAAPVNESDDIPF